MPGKLPGAGRRQGGGSDAAGGGVVEFRVSGALQGADSNQAMGRRNHPVGQPRDVNCACDGDPRQRQRWQHLLRLYSGGTGPRMAQVRGRINVGRDT